MKKILLTGAILLSVAGLVYYEINHQVNDMLSHLNQSVPFEEYEVHAVKPVEKKVEKKAIQNIALLGIDKDYVGEGSRSDAMKIISFDYEQKTLRFSSLQRDNLVYLPMKERYEKLNHAYWRNGVQGSLSAINYNFDLDITQYVLFHYDDMEEIIDLLGGVNLDLSESEANYLKIGHGGNYILNGKDALRFCRIRYLDSDYVRMDRQNRVIKAIIDQYKDKNLIELVSISKQILPYIETNLTNQEIKEILKEGLTFDLDNIEKYQFPSEGYDSQLCTLSLYGYSPMYVLKDFSGEVEKLHHHIEGNELYQASENVLHVEEEMLQLAGYR